MTWAETSQIFLSIAESIAAAVIIAIVVAFRRGLAELFDQFILHIRPLSSGAENDMPDLERLGNRLTRMLRRDQSSWGRHVGEFGKRLDGNSGDFQSNPLSRARLIYKPRMYLTYWSTKVLAGHDLELRAVALALRGVERLFVDGGIRTTSSLPQNVRSGTAISFRHSMCGALLLSSVRGWCATSRSVLGRVLEGCSAWQQADLGWAQDSDDMRSDLWSSAFAAQLLHMVAEDETLPPQTRAHSRHHLQRTMSYFRNEWFKNGWAYHKLTSEENGVLIFIELAAIIAATDKELFQDVLKRLKSNINEWGQFTTSYLNTPGLLRGRLTAPMLYARFAYALQRAGEGPTVWRPVFLNAIGSVKSPFNAADVAFLLDLTMRLKRHSQAEAMGISFSGMEPASTFQIEKEPTPQPGNPRAGSSRSAVTADTRIWRCGIYDYPPLSEWHQKADTDPSGPLVELARRIAGALGKTLAFEKFNYDDFYQDEARIPDMVMGMFATSMRSRRVIFSRAIYEIGLQGICRKEQTGGDVLAALREGALRVAVYSGEVGWEFVKSELPDADLQHRVATLVGGHQLHTMVLLTQHTYDVVIMDELSCANFLREDNHDDKFRLAFGRPPKMYEVCVALKSEHRGHVVEIDRAIVHARNSDEFLRIERAALTGYEKIIDRRALRAHV